VNVVGNSVGKTIKLFLVDGVPDGIRTAEIMNWTGHILFAPRSSIVELLLRAESRKTGAYLLIGRDPDNADQEMVYVGEGDNVGHRISSHNRDKDKEFWEHACVITSKDLNLTKAHVRYLESQLIRLIGQEGRAILANKSEPDFDLLPEADLSDMDDFIVRLQILLPVLGVGFIRPTPMLRPLQRAAFPHEGSSIVAPTMPGRSIEASTDGIEFKMNAGGLQARAVEIGGQMVVLKDSQARSEEAPSLSSHVRTFRDQLRRSGKLIADAGNLRFTDDVAFNSPSAAAQAIMATSRNGRTDWINATTNETYAAWQDRAIAKAETTQQT
jgi:hypothetical protein